MLFFDDNSGDDQFNAYDNFVPQKQWLAIHANLWAEHFIRPIKTRNKAMTFAFNKEYFRIKGLYTFLEETQILGKTYNKFYIPNICGKISKSFLQKHAASKRYQKKIGNFNLKATRLVSRKDLSSRNNSENVKKPVKFFTSKLNKRFNENKFDFDYGEEFEKSKTVTEYATHKNKNKMTNLVQSPVDKSNHVTNRRRSILKENNYHFIQKQGLVFNDTEMLEGEKLAKYNNNLQCVDDEERNTAIDKLINWQRVKKSVHFKDSKLCSFEPSQEPLTDAVPNSRKIISTETEMLFNQFLQKSKLEENKKQNIIEKSSYETLLENNARKNLNQVNKSAYQEIQINPVTLTLPEDSTPTPEILFQKKTNLYTHKPIYIDIMKKDEIQINGSTNESLVDTNPSFDDRFAQSPVCGITENIKASKDQTQNRDTEFDKMNKYSKKMPITLDKSVTSELLNDGDTEILVNEKQQMNETFENDVECDSNSSGRAYEDDLFSQYTQNSSPFVVSQMETDISVFKNNENIKEIEVNQITDDTLEENNTMLQKSTSNSSINVSSSPVGSQDDDASKVTNKIGLDKSHIVSKNNEYQESNSGGIEATQQNKLESFKYNEFACGNYLTPAPNKEIKGVIKAPKKKETQLYDDNSLLKTIQNLDNAPICDNGFSLSECNKYSNKISKKKLFEISLDKENSLDSLKNIDNIEQVGLIDYNCLTDPQCLIKQLQHLSKDSSIICEINYKTHKQLEKDSEKVTENQLKTKDQDHFNDIGFENIEHATSGNSFVDTGNDEEVLSLFNKEENYTNLSNKCSQQNLKGLSSSPEKEIVSESDLCLKHKIEESLSNHKVFLEEFELHHNKNKKLINSSFSTSDKESSRYLDNNEEKSLLEQDLIKTNMCPVLVTEFLMNTNSNQTKIDRIQNLDLTAESRSNLNKSRLPFICSNYYERLPLKNIEKKEIHANITADQTNEKEIQALSRLSSEDNDDFIITPEDDRSSSKQKRFKRKHNIMDKSISAVIVNSKESNVYKIDNNDGNVSIESEFSVPMVQKNREKSKEINFSSTQLSSLQNNEQENTNSILINVHKKKHTNIIITEKLHSKPNTLITNSGNSYEFNQNNNSMIQPTTDNSGISEPQSKISIELVGKEDNFGDNVLINRQRKRKPRDIIDLNKIASNINHDFVNDRVNLTKDNASKTLPGYNKRIDTIIKYKNIIKSEQLGGKTVQNFGSIDEPINSPPQSSPFILPNQEIQQTNPEQLYNEQKRQLMYNVDVIDAVNSPPQTNLSILSGQEIQSGKHKNIIITSERLGRKTIQNFGSIDEPINSPPQSSPFILPNHEIQQTNHEQLYNEQKRQLIYNVDVIDAVNSPPQTNLSILSGQEIQSGKHTNIIITSERLGRNHMDNVNSITELVNSLSQSNSFILSSQEVVLQRKPKAIIRSEHSNIDPSWQTIDNVNVMDGPNYSLSQTNSPILLRQETEQRKHKNIKRSKQLSWKFIDNVDSISRIVNSPSQIKDFISSSQEIQQGKNKDTLKCEQLDFDKSWRAIGNVHVTDKPVNSPQQINPPIILNQTIGQRKPKATISCERLDIDKSWQAIDKVDFIDRFVNFPPQIDPSIISNTKTGQRKRKAIKGSKRLDNDKSRQAIDNVNVTDKPVNSPQQINPPIILNQKIGQRKPKATISCERLGIDKSWQAINNFDVIDEPVNSPLQINPSIVANHEIGQRKHKNIRGEQLDIDKSWKTIDNVHVTEEPVNVPVQNDFSIPRQDTQRNHKTIIRCQPLGIDKSRQSLENVDDTAGLVYCPVQTDISILSRGIQQKYPKNIVRIRNLGDVDDTESAHNLYGFSKPETQNKKPKTSQSIVIGKSSDFVDDDIGKENEPVDFTVQKTISALNKQNQINVLSECLHSDQKQSTANPLSTSKLSRQNEKIKSVDHYSKYKSGGSIVDKYNFTEPNFAVHEDSYSFIRSSMNNTHSKTTKGGPSKSMIHNDNIPVFSSNPNTLDDNIGHYSGQHLRMEDYFLNLGKSKYSSQQSVQKPRNPFHSDKSNRSSNETIIPTQKTQSSPFTSNVLKPNVNSTTSKDIQTCEDIGETNITVSPIKTMHDKLSNNNYVIYSYHSSQSFQEKSFQICPEEDLSSIHSNENSSVSDNDSNYNLLSAEDENFSESKNLQSNSSEDRSVNQNIVNTIWSDSGSKTSSTGIGFGFDYDLPSYSEGNTSISSPIVTDDASNDPWLSP